MFSFTTHISLGQFISFSGVAVFKEGHEKFCKGSGPHFQTLTPFSWFKTDSFSYNLCNSQEEVTKKKRFFYLWAEWKFLAVVLGCIRLWVIHLWSRQGITVSGISSKLLSWNSSHVMLLLLCCVIQLQLLSWNCYLLLHHPYPLLTWCAWKRLDGVFLVQSLLTFAHSKLLVLTSKHLSRNIIRTVSTSLPNHVFVERLKRAFWRDQVLSGPCLPEGLFWKSWHNFHLLLFPVTHV